MQNAMLANSGYEYEKRLAAWQNAGAVLGLDPYSERVDCDGRVVKWNEYGQLSQYGWEIDHAVPKVVGGSDSSWNLRARHWRGNRKAGAELNAMLRFAKT